MLPMLLLDSTIIALTPWPQPSTVERHQFPPVLGRVQALPPLVPTFTPAVGRSMAS
jgi:hypothetical protein